MPDSAKDIEKAKQKAIDALSITVMGAAAYEIVMQAIEETFDTKAGKIVASKAFIKQLNKLSVDILSLIQSEPKFIGSVSQYVKRMPAISDAIARFQKSVNGIAVPAFEVSKKIAIDEIIDRMTGNGLNQNFVQPLRNLIYQNVTSGLSLTEARNNIREYIKGGKDISGKLGSYLEQTAIQGVSVYSGIINTKILETFDMDGLLITGSLIDNSSPQCRYAVNVLNGKITRENFAEFEKIGKDHGLTPGTTFDNLPIRLSHWGCRHSFYPVLINKLKKAA